jgi:hypothetical protein
VTVEARAVFWGVVWLVGLGSCSLACTAESDAGTSTVVANAREPGDAAPGEAVVGDGDENQSGSTPSGSERDASDTDGNETPDPEVESTDSLDAGAADASVPRPFVCPEPLEQPPGSGCIGVVAYARHPESGTCCEYSSPCVSPQGWPVFATSYQCAGEDSLHWFRSCGAPVCHDDGVFDVEHVPNCGDSQTEGAVCDAEDSHCDGVYTCGATLVCTAQPPETLPVGCPL